MKDALKLRDNAKYELEQIKDLETGIDYLNKVKAIETWAKAEKKDNELQNIIAEQKIRTQRILGNLIKTGQKNGELAKEGSFNGNQYVGDSRKEPPKKLVDIGITKKQSSMFQTIASIPEKVFNREIEKAKEESEKRVELTTNRMLAVAKAIHYKKNIPKVKPKEPMDVDSFIEQLEEILDNAQAGLKTIVTYEIQISKKYRRFAMALKSLDEIIQSIKIKKL